jgi:phage/plasmid-like protein (TIGR03299 family)
MAHELEIMENGEASMAYVGEVPWHGLGKRVPADLTPEQMLKAANLDWTVEKIPLFYNTESGPVMTNERALVRSTDKKLLTVVSEAWKPVQNLEAFEFFNDFVHAGDMEMHTAGSLRDGKMVWAMAQIKESFELFGGDKVDGYLLFSNPHEFGRSIDVRFTPVRVVCNNTLTLAIEGEHKNSVKVNHRSVFDADEVKATLGIARDQLAKYKEQALFLGSKKFMKENLVEYFNRVFPTMSKDQVTADDMRKVPISRQAEEAVSVLHTQPGARFAEGSWWHAFNTVTYLTDHVLGRNNDTRLTSAWYGQNRVRKEKALELAIEYAEAA